MTRPRFWCAMFIVFAAALFLRVGAATLVPDGTDCGSCGAGYQINERVGGDGVHYLLVGRDLAAGRGFVYPKVPLPEAAKLLVPQQVTGDPYAQQPPLWSLIMGATEVVGLRNVIAKKLLFALLGAATAVLIGLAGRQIASDRVGIVAGAIAAIYPGFWIYERNFNAETIAFPLIAVVLILAYRYRERPQSGLAVALGAALGVLVLARSEQVLLVPILLLPLMLFTSDARWEVRIGRLAAATTVMVLVLAPWAVYNLNRFEHPVLLSTGLGFTARAGACDSTFYGSRLGSFDARECVRGHRLEGEDATETDARLREVVLDYTKSHLQRLPIVVAAREGRTWSIFPPGLQLSLNGQMLNAPPWTLWLQLVMYWIVLMLAVVGAILLRRRHIALYPLLAFPLTVVLSTAMTFGDSRYRAPAEVTFVILAAVTIEWLLLRRGSIVQPPASQQEVRSATLALDLRNVR